MTDNEILKRIKAELIACKKAQAKADTVIPLSFDHDVWLKQEKMHRNNVMAWIDKFHNNK